MREHFLSATEKKARVISPEKEKRNPGKTRSIFFLTNRGSLNVCFAMDNNFTLSQGFMGSTNN